MGDDRNQIINCKYNLKQYLVCYIDLLGIRDNLFPGIDYHSSAVTESKQSAINDFSNNINFVLDELAIFANMFHERADVVYDYAKKFYDKMLIAKDEFVEKSKFLKFKIQQFSDSMLLYASISEDPDFIVPELISFWFLWLSAWSLNSFSKGLMFRGCITIGTAWEIRDGCLFGPAIHEVYQLESEVAKHPRIVVSRTLKDFITKHEVKLRQAGIDIKDVPTSLKMLRMDSDGVYMVAYLSEILEKIIELNGWTKTRLNETIMLAFNMILREYQLHVLKGADNPKEAELSRRYRMVLAYFLENEQIYPDAIKVIKTCGLNANNKV